MNAGQIMGVLRAVGQSLRQPAGLRASGNGVSRLDSGATNLISKPYFQVFHFRTGAPLGGLPFSYAKKGVSQDVSAKYHGP
jgi:hypothetical protein